MVPDDAVDALVVVDRVVGPEVDDDAGVGLRGHGALGLREAEDVAGLVEELELGGQLGVVVDGEHAVDHLAQPGLKRVPHLLVVDGAGREEDVEGLGVAHALDAEGVAADVGDLEVAHRGLLRHQRPSIRIICGCTCR